MKLVDCPTQETTTSLHEAVVASADVQLGGVSAAAVRSAEMGGRGTIHSAIAPASVSTAAYQNPEAMET